MFCQRCGALVPEETDFCDACSQKLFSEQPETAAPGDVFAGQGPPGQQAYRYEAPSTAEVRRRSEGNRNYATAGVVTTAVAGVIVLLSTWLAWMSANLGAGLAGGSATASGWQFMINGSQVGGNFVWLKAVGILYFSGLWSLLAGTGILAGVVMMLMGSKTGGHVAGIFAVIGVGTATVNLVMVFKLGGGNGIGIWLFLLFSIAAVVGGEIAHRYWTDAKLFA